MARHGSPRPTSARPTSACPTSPRATSPRRTSPRPASPRLARSTPAPGRLAVVAVAAGALATAGHGVSDAGLVPEGDAVSTGTLALRADTVVGPRPAASPDAGDAAVTGVLPVVAPVAATTTVPTVLRTSGDGGVGSLTKSRRLADAAGARAAAARVVRPAEGSFTSGFGTRWGAQHKGVDIANAIGTPIHALAAGRVLEAGPASGFGQWVRLQHDDGTISVYGHVNRFFVTAGQRVAAGDEIAEIGNRGQSTGPHLHLEIWTSSGNKIDPAPWLAARGISLGGGGGDAGDAGD